jgi:hypothetical protein
MGPAFRRRLACDPVEKAGVDLVGNVSEDLGRALRALNGADLSGGVGDKSINDHLDRRTGLNDHRFSGQFEELVAGLSRDGLVSGGGRILSHGHVL